MNTDHLHRMAELMLITNPSRGIAVDALTAVLESLAVTRLEDGQPLCRQGDPGDELWILVNGGIRVHRDEEDGSSRDLITMKPPSMVGHMALVDDQPRSAHCSADGETTLLTMDRELYKVMLLENSERGTALRRLLLTSLTRQLQGATSRIKSVQSPAAENSDGAYLLGPTAAKRRAKELAEIASVLNGWTMEGQTE
jgi:CRP-like cAMP-binding protein